LGLGIKLYSSFSDGTVLVTVNFPSCNIAAGSGSSVIKEDSTMDQAGAWTRHQHRVRELESGGKILLRSVNFDQYVEMSRREETAPNISPT
jgi:hypothetical protein